MQNVPDSITQTSAQVSDGLGARALFPEETWALERERKKRRVSAVIVFLLAPGFIASPFWFSKSKKRRGATCERIVDYCAKRCEPGKDLTRFGPRAFEICIDQCMPATCQ